MPLAKPVEAHVSAMFASEMLPDIPQAGSDLAELTTWDFLQDLDFGGVGDSALPLGSSATTPATNAERLKEKNRKAQKRFRERKKVRMTFVNTKVLTLLCRAFLHVLSVFVGTDTDDRSSTCRDHKPAAPPATEAA